MKKQRILLFAFAFLFSLSGSAQQANPFLNDVNGQPLFLKTSYNAEGSPYFQDDYLPATLFLASGKRYDNVAVKINLSEKLVQFRNSKGEETITVDPVSKVVFPAVIQEDGSRQQVTIIGIPGPINGKESDLFVVLDSGTVSLLKKVTITYKDIKPFNQASITRIFQSSNILYLLPVGKEMERVEKKKEFFTSRLSAKSGLVEQYLKDKHPNFRNELDLAALLHFYNKN